MTDQALNGLRVDGVGYDIVDAKPGVFSPWDYGIEPQSVCTANWSGYIAYFAVKDKRLCLSSLNVGRFPTRGRAIDSGLGPDDPLRVLDPVALNLELEPAPLPLLNGVAPEAIGGSYMEYRELNMPLDYTGRLVGCKGNPRSPKAGDCLEFVFEAGVLMEAIETQWNDLV